MENKKTLGNENAEVQTEEKRNDVAGEITTDSTEQTSVVNADNIETDDEETADECVAVDLRRKEKAIIITIGVILAFLLVCLIIWAMGAGRGGNSTLRSDNDDNYSYSNSDSASDNADDKNGAYDADNGKESGTQGNGSGSNVNPPSNSGNNGNSGNNNPAGNNNGGNNGSNGNGGNGNNGGNSGNNDENDGTATPDTGTSPSGGNQGDKGDNQKPDTSSGNDKGDPTPSDTTGGDNSSSGNDNGNGNGGNNGGGNQNDDNKGDDAAPDYTGETKVRISEVNDDTGFVTITIDGTSITVPLQTTIFNGRVTKSGVAQGKIFGYNSGVTVMFFYLQDEGFHTTEVNAYMNRTSDALTVLVDINGDGSKLLIKVNGMKSLF